MLTQSKSLAALLLTAALLTASAQAKAPMNLIPKDADIVAYADVRQMLGAKLIKKHAVAQIEKELKNSADAQKFLKAIDVDPMKDLDGVLLTITGTDAKKVLVVLQGSFKTEKIHRTLDAWAKAEPRKVSVQNVGGTKLYQFNEGDTPAYAAALDNSTVVVSTVKDYVTDAINGKLGKPRAKLQSALSSVPAKQSFWAAGVIPEEVKEMLKAQPPAAQIAAKLVAFTTSAVVSADVAASIQIHTTDAQAAATLQMAATQVKGLLGILGRDNDAIKPIIMDLLISLKIESKQSTVDLSFTLSEKSIEAIEKLATKSQ